MRKSTVFSLASLVAFAKQVECFGFYAGSFNKYLPSLTKSQISFLSLQFKRSQISTKLRYRNSPYDTNIDFYNILGVPRTANSAEIKRAYRNLAKRFHPDANRDMDTTEIFQQLNRAYEVLKDRDLRLQFDRFGSEGIGNSYSSDKKAKGQNTKKPDEVYYKSETNPFDPFAGARSTNFAYEIPKRHSYPGEPERNQPTRSSMTDPFHDGREGWGGFFADSYDPFMSSERFSNGRHEPRFVKKGFDTSFRNNPINSSHQSVGKSARHTNRSYQRVRVNHGSINTGHQQVRSTFTSFSDQTGVSPQSMGDMAGFSVANAGSNVGQNRGTRQRWVGGDLCIEIEISSSTAINGGEENIRIKHLEACSSCKGDGIHPGAMVKTCMHCGGSGAVLHKAKPVGMGATDNATGHKVCSHCRGTGQSVAENCDSCYGKGTKEAIKQMSLIVPPGVTNGSKLRLKGEGDAGPMGGPAGDLFIFLKIASGFSTR